MIHKYPLPISIINKDLLRLLGTLALPHLRPIFEQAPHEVFIKAPLKKSDFYLTLDDFCTKHLYLIVDTVKIYAVSLPSALEIQSSNVACQLGMLYTVVDEYAGIKSSIAMQEINADYANLLIVLEFKKQELEIFKVI